MKAAETALVLEGGATRGIFTAGVLDYMMEQELEFPYVVGVSAGACNAVDYVSGQIGRTRMCMVQQKEKSARKNIERVVKKRCLYDMDRIFDRFPNELIPFDYDAYFASPIRCEMVVTNCITGRAEYLEERSERERLMKICRASSSLPLLSSMTYVDSVPYLDGGLSDSIPIRRALKSGCRRAVVILTRNPGYRKRPSMLQYDLCSRFYGEYPQLLEAVRRRPAHYNRTLDLIEKLEEEGRIFVLRPVITPVKKTEGHGEKLLEFYEHGYELMKEEWQNLTDFLAQ